MNIQKKRKIMNSPGPIRIGFSGGGNVISCGSVEDFLLFFSAIKRFINWKEGPSRKSEYLVCNRLYKKYVKTQDLNNTTETILFIQQQFNKIQSDNGQKLSNIFSKIFSAYNRCTESISYYLNKGDEECAENLQIIVTLPLPYASFDLHRSLEELDNWDGPPFWTRFYLKELYDQGKEMPELPF